MLSRAGKSQQLNRTKLKSGSGIWTGHCYCPNEAHSQIKINWWSNFAGVISNAMPCIQHHEHHVTYCAVSASENWRSWTQNFARVRAVWVSVEPNIRWQYEALLWSSRPDVHKLLRLTWHVSVVLPVEHNEKLCFIVQSFEAGTILLLKMCCHFTQRNIWDCFCGIYVQCRNC